MITLIEVTLEGLTEVTTIGVTWDVADTIDGCVGPATNIPGFVSTEDTLQGGAPSPFDIVERMWMASLPFDVAVSPDEFFVAYTDALSGALTYLIYEDGNRALLEQGGYVVL